MVTTDVNPNATATEERFTNHLFDLSMQPHIGVSGQAIHVPSSDDKKSNWPPTSLFEAIYASAIMCHFGAVPVDLFKSWEKVFYEPDRTSNKCQHDQADAKKENCKRQKTEQQQCYNEQQRHRDGGGFDAFDVLMMIPFMVMPAEKARDYFDGCEKMAAEKEQEGLEVKVNSWREGVPSTCNNS